MHEGGIIEGRVSFEYESFYILLCKVWINLPISVIFEIDRKQDSWISLPESVLDVASVDVVSGIGSQGELFKFTENLHIELIFIYSKLIK